MRVDCSDFGVPNIIRILYSRGVGSLDSDPIKREQLKQGILGWQYWIDQIEGTEPDNHFQGSMEVWTENHQMDFHVAEYLAGMLYPDEIFWGTNMTGEQHADTGRGFVIRWLERRYRWGFSEWRSATYYQFCFHSVTTLVSLAPVSHFCACIGSPCLMQCVHGAPIGAAGGGACGDCARPHAAGCCFALAARDASQLARTLLW